MSELDRPAPDSKPAGAQPNSEPTVEDIRTAEIAHYTGLVGAMRTIGRELTEQDESLITAVAEALASIDFGLSRDFKPPEGSNLTPHQMLWLVANNAGVDHWLPGLLTSYLGDEVAVPDTSLGPGAEVAAQAEERAQQVLALTSRIYAAMKRRGIADDDISDPVVMMLVELLTLASLDLRKSLTGLATRQRRLAVSHIRGGLKKALPAVNDAELRKKLKAVIAEFIQ